MSKHFEFFEELDRTLLEEEEKLAELKLYSEELEAEQLYYNWINLRHSTSLPLEESIPPLRPLDAQE